MKLIPLTRGYFAQVDDADYEWLNQWKWYAQVTNNNIYAKRDKKINKHRIHIAMHNLIMNPPDRMVVDHIDHNGLNCQRINMRICTHRQNTMNSSATGASKYLGVGICSKGVNKGHITAQIHVSTKKIFLGNFKSEEAAAIAYDKAAIQYFGEFANLNFKEIKYAI